jgi:hypothetical protein
MSDNDDQPSERSDPFHVPVYDEAHAIRLAKNSHQSACLRNGSEIISDRSHDYFEPQQNETIDGFEGTKE